MKEKAPLYKTPLATARVRSNILLFSKAQSTIKNNPERKEATIVYNTSSNGLDFSARNILVSIIYNRKEIDAQTIVSLKIFSSGTHYTMTLEKMSEQGGIQVLTGTSDDMKKWHMEASPLPVPFGRQALYVPKQKRNSKDLIYYSDREIWVKTKNPKKKLEKKLKKHEIEDTSDWQLSHIVANPRLDNFDSQPLDVIGVIPQEEGLFVIYSSQLFSGTSVDLGVGSLISSYTDPGAVISRSQGPLWQGHFDKVEYLVPLGAESIKKNIFLYFRDIHNEVIVVEFSQDISESQKPVSVRRGPGSLVRSEKNPIISPRKGKEWEVDGTFNPAAFEDDHGHVHLLYRAIGHDGISRIGLATSSDGIHFAHRSVSPVFEPGLGFGLPDPKHISGPAMYNPAFYTSGGGWGGAEDPRVVKIKNRLYMVYVAFEGWDSVRIALTSIDMNDFHAGNWKWKKPIHISPPGQVNKNWLLFPEKIKGKFALLHSIAPKVSVAYLDSLDHFETYIDSPRPQGPQPGRMGFWDNLLRGAGPPPIKTNLGWLLLYHALDKRDMNKYKLGAMILDKNDPTKVLYRSNQPILGPEMYYENEGKPGVVYASGAIVRGNTLYVYYGGGDRVVCVATAPLDQFISHIEHNQSPLMKSHKIVLE